MAPVIDVPGAPQDVADAAQASITAFLAFAARDQAERAAGSVTVVKVGSAWMYLDDVVELLQVAAAGSRIEAVAHGMQPVQLRAAKAAAEASGTALVLGRAGR